MSEEASADRVVYLLMELAFYVASEQAHGVVIFFIVYNNAKNIYTASHRRTMHLIRSGDGDILEMFFSKGKERRLS